jgi:HD-like signal output (HDOD) protein
VLTDHYDFISSDRAVLGGLLQNVGALLLMTIVDEKLTDLKHEAILEVMIKQYACEFGAKLLTHWEMDAELIAVAQNRNNWNRSHAEAADLADLILLAKSCLQYNIDSNYGLPEHQTLTAFEKLQATYPIDVELQKLIHENSGRIDSMRNMLSA